MIKEFPKKSIIKRWFKDNSPWCPLFGVIPFKFFRRDPKELGRYSDPFEQRCLRIIEQGRQAWKVGPHLGMPGSHSWPKPEDVSWYPKGDLLTARGIFWHVLDIFGASQIWYPDMDPDQIKHSEILWHARDYGRSFEGAKEVDDYKMLAIFSIHLAWTCLEEVLSEEANADDPEILKGLLLAEAFFKEAENVQKVRLRDRFKKAAQKGGQANKKAKKFLDACKLALKESPNKNALALWRFIAKNYCDDFGFDLEYDKEENKFYEHFADGRFRPISFRTFQRYISDLKKNRTK